MKVLTAIYLARETLRHSGGEFWQRCYCGPSSPSESEALKILGCAQKTPNERTKWNGQFGKRPKYVAAVSTIAALSQGRLQTAACPTTVAAWPAMFILSVFSFGKVKFISYNKGQIQVLSSGIWTKLWTIYQILTATP